METEEIKELIDNRMYIKDVISFLEGVREIHGELAIVVSDGTTDRYLTRPDIKTYYSSPFGESHVHSDLTVSFVVEPSKTALNNALKTLKF